MKKMLLITIGVVIATILAYDVYATAEQIDPADFDWDITYVSYGTEPDVAVDSDGRPHLSYGVDYGSEHYAMPTSIMHAYLNNEEWIKEEAVYTSPACASTSIHLDNTDKIHLIYAIHWGSGIWYLKKEDNLWVEEKVTGPWTLNYERSAIDKLGNPHVIFYNASANGSMMYKTKDNGTWTLETIGDAPIYREQYGVDICVDDNNNPHVLYDTSTSWNHYFHYAHKENSEWVVQDLKDIVASLGIQTETLSLRTHKGCIASDSEGNIYILINRWDWGDNPYNYLTLLKKSENGWSYEDVLDSGPHRFSLALDKNNQVHIATVGFGNGMRYGYKDVSEWHFNNIFVNGILDVVDPPLMIIDEWGFPHITGEFSGPGRGYIYYITPYRNQIFNNPPVNPSIDFSREDYYAANIYDLHLSAEGAKQMIITTIPPFGYTPEWEDYSSLKPIAVRDGVTNINVRFRGDDPLQETEPVFTTIVYNNIAPVLSSIGNKTVTESETLTFYVSASDENDDDLTFSVIDAPNGASFTQINQKRYKFSWTPTYEQAGTYEVTFIASDGDLYDSETITITVNNTPLPDITIGEIKYWPKNPRVGNIVRFMVIISNTEGEKETGPFYIEGYLNGQKRTSKRIDSIEAGQESMIIARWKAKWGWHIIKVVADPEGEVLELQEDNNEKEITIGVRR